MVFLRFYARRISGSSYGLDDCAIAAALVSLSCQKLASCSNETAYTARGHPDANVVSIIPSIWLLTLTAVGWVARRTHSSACARLHQIELPPSLPAYVYESRWAPVRLGELVHDCHHYRVDDRILLHITLPLPN